MDGVIGLFAFSFPFAVGTGGVTITMNALPKTTANVINADHDKSFAFASRTRRRPVIAAIVHLRSFRLVIHNLARCGVICLVAMPAAFQLGIIDVIPNRLHLLLEIESFSAVNRDACLP